MYEKVVKESRPCWQPSWQRIVERRGAGRREGGTEENKRWRVEKRDSVEEAKEQAYQPGINKILRATEW